MASKKPTLKSVQAAYIDFRVKAHSFINSVLHPGSRILLSIVAADQEGRISAITVPELITIVKLTENTGERVIIEAHDKTVTFLAEKRNPSVSPYELRS